MKKEITVSQIRKVAAMWVVKLHPLVRNLRGTAQAKYRGQLETVLKILDLIDGKNDKVTEGENKTKPSSGFKYLYFGQFPEREILKTDEYKVRGKTGSPLKWTIFEDTGRRTSEFMTFIYRRKITLTKEVSGKIRVNS
ncbi:MAG: hypothetical protein PHS34_08860 [Candidatus Omnitrophica bacterium]|nr:hypothetical protein [Candidatus Omnitrophota bacterium]